jgi:hypothetical protein
LRSVALQVKPGDWVLESIADSREWLCRWAEEEKRDADAELIAVAAFSKKL